MCGTYSFSTNKIAIAFSILARILGRVSTAPSSRAGTIRHPERCCTCVREERAVDFHRGDREISASQGTRRISVVFNSLDRLFRSHRQISQRGDRRFVPRRSLGWNCFHHLRAGSECREPNLIQRRSRRDRATALKLDWRISDDDRVTMREAAFEFGRAATVFERSLAHGNAIIV